MSRLSQKLIKNLLSLFVLIIISLAVYEILKLDILPDKYLTLFLVLEISLFTLAFILYNIRKKFLIIIGLIFYILLIGGNIFGYYYLSKVNSYFSNNLAKDTYTIKTTYYLVTSKNNGITKLDEVSKDELIYYYRYSRSIKKAVRQLGTYSYKSIDTVIDSLNSISENNKYLLIASADYNYLFENSKIDIINKDNYKVIHEFVVSDEVKTNKEVLDVYNIYINGLDFTGVMRDYNLILTVNTKTHKMVLTSIPRDYYIDVPGYNMKDTLMCLGSIDSEVSKEALEKLFDIKINYTINLNTNSLVGIVDSIDGVEFCSDIDFTTTHALVTNTYDDTKGRKLYVPKGCNTYNGVEILAIARERNAFPGRDRYRQKNCRQILLNIAKKLASTTTLTNYNEIINSFDGLYTTDMNDKTIKQLIKSALEDTNFEIIEQSVDGTDGIGVGHLGTQESWIMTPNMDTVNEASKKIKEVQKEK